MALNTNIQIFSLETESWTLIKLIDIFNALEAYPVPGASPTSQANFVDLARRLRPKLS